MKNLITCLVVSTFAGMGLMSSVNANSSSPLADDINNSLRLEYSWHATLSINQTPEQPIRIAIPIENTTYTLELDPYSIRADDYTVFMQDDGGELYEVPAGSVRTLRGSIEELDGSIAVGSLMPDGLYARIRLADGQEYWMEPVGKKIDRAPHNLYAFYRTEDIIPSDGVCGVKELIRGDGSIGFQTRHETNHGSIRSTGVCTAQLGIDTDYEYYQDWGNSTESRINQIINSINVQYESEVNLTHEITTIIIRSSVNDPYSENNAQSFLNEFTNEWTNNQSSITRDVAHLFTGKELDGSIIGIAWVGTVCNYEYQYGLAQSDFDGSFGCVTDLSSHELGHNWNADHCNCPEYTMNPTITCANQFTQSSINSITSFANSLSCLSCAPEPTGACCLSDCILVSEEECLSFGGVYYGDYIDCGPTQETKLFADDGEHGDYFGESVSIDGNTMLIGAEGRGGNATEGAAYIFRFNGTTWVQEDKLLPDDAEHQDHFGGSVSISGNTALIGASGNGSEPGAAYIFRYNGSAWFQEAKLLSKGGELGDYFGWVVSVFGDTALVGASRDTENGTFSGAAYIYRFDGSSWIQEDKLIASDGDSHEHFGYSVSIDGDTALIGSYHDDDNGSFSGSAYIYRFDGTQWIEEPKLLASDGGSGDFFGSSVSIFGNTAVVGAFGDDDNGTNSGSAYVFRYNGMTWEQEGKLLAYDGEPSSYFGSAVSIFGDTVVVGTQFSNDDINSGAPYVYRFDGSQWVDLERLLSSSGSRFDHFGYSISIYRNTVLVGANLDGDDAYIGAVYVFTLGVKCKPVSIGACCFADGTCANNYTADACSNSNGTYWGDGIECTPNLCPTDCPDINGDGYVNVTDILALISAWHCVDCDDEDVNADGIVNVSDLLLVISNWGPCE